jgi:hypothetical protein
MDTFERIQDLMWRYRALQWAGESHARLKPGLIKLGGNECPLEND